MKIDGYNVDSPGSFRKHFSLPALLNFLEQPVVFKAWMKAMADSCTEPSTQKLLQQLEAAYHCRCSGEDNPDAPDLEELPGSASENQRLFPAEIACFQNDCYIISLLLEIGQHTVTESDIQAVHAVLRPRRLWMRISPGKPPVLCCGEREIEPLPQPQSLPAFPELVSAAQDPDTGFLGITAGGSLVNGSALHVPPVEGKVVKALLRHDRFALLLEDGTVVHNLVPETALPSKAENIRLTESELICTPF